eukprot:m.466930 g.466930  ORF g.466930 m.466930 type:complete len:239 (-) comp25715_c0_seq1:207-923(-)
MALGLLIRSTAWQQPRCLWRNLFRQTQQQRLVCHNQASRAGMASTEPAAGAAAAPTAPPPARGAGTGPLRAPVYSVAVTLIDALPPRGTEGEGEPGPRVLMVQRGNEPRKGHWYLPGGKVELGETTVRAALRELHEECGLTPADVALHPRPFTVVDAIIPGEDGAPAWHYPIAQCFGVATDSGTVGRVVAGDDADAVGWYTVDEIRAIEAAQATGECAEVASLGLRMSRLGLLPTELC